jgi:cell division septation protein DedD
MMITIVEAISELLFVRDTVVVPGLGAFVKKPVSAKVNPVANYFAMPSSEIGFDANLREDNDLVVNYIAEKNDIPDDEARRLLAMFVSDCFSTMKQGKKVPLKQIGTLYYDWADDLVFEQDKTLNYNADSFGLSDFTPEPVLRSKTKDEIKAEIEQQQKDKNTPVTVDEKAVHEHDEDDKDEPFDDDKRGFGWLWIVLGVLLVAGIVYGLDYFKVIDVRSWLGKPSKRVIDIEPGKYQLPTYTVDWDAMLEEYERIWKPAEIVEETIAEETPVEMPTETVSETPSEAPTESPTVSPVETPAETPVAVPTEAPVSVVPDANIRIIAGCFDQEENAVRLVNSLKSKGYQTAFYELRNKRWFVSFGRYATNEEATAALREIRANTEYKAWILK